jgi:hypothetical protein
MRDHAIPLASGFFPHLDLDDRERRAGVFLAWPLALMLILGPPASSGRLDDFPLPGSGYGGARMAIKSPEDDLNLKDHFHPYCLGRWISRGFRDFANLRDG